jgi:DNA-binding winged helix-turn-helix (wHTH) protein
MRYLFADCVLDTQLYTLSRAGTPLPLRPKVFQVLCYLIEHRNHVVSKDELCA